jgi:hypothetical protein
VHIPSLCVFVLCLCLCCCSVDLRSSVLCVSAATRDGTPATRGREEGATRAERGWENNSCLLSLLSDPTPGEVGPPRTAWLYCMSRAAEPAAWQRSTGLTPAADSVETCVKQLQIVPGLGASQLGSPSLHNQTLAQSKLLRFRASNCSGSSLPTALHLLLHPSTRISTTHPLLLNAPPSSSCCGRGRARDVGAQLTKSSFCSSW